jgi:DNA-binding beta-propeller fold protein YncE
MIGQRVRVAAKLEVGPTPGHIAFQPDGACVFVGCQMSNQVVAIDLMEQRVIEAVNLGAASEAVH